MRRMIDFDCCGDRLVGTLNQAAGTTGLLIVSGGNEIRSGAYAGQAALAQHFAGKGHPIFRYDRRGIGDSEGINRGFEGSADDIAAAAVAFRTEAPQMQRLVAFGNCDAGTALALFHADLSIDALILANPWVIQSISSEPDAPTPLNTAAIRARYLARLKNPRSLVDLLTGQIDLRKLAGGLAKIIQNEKPNDCVAKLALALAETQVPVHLLIANRDTTALAFMAAWKTALFDSARAKVNIKLAFIDTASHSFTDATSKACLFVQIAMSLETKT